MKTNNIKKIFISIIAASVTTFTSAATIITVPHPAGGAPDVWARTVAQQLSEQLQQEFIVVNRVGADGRIAVEHTATRPKDNPELIVASTGSFLFNEVLYKNLKYTHNDFDVMAPMVRVPVVMTVSNKLGVTNFKEFVALAKTKSLNCAGSGSSSVFLGRYMFDQLKIRNVEFIPFKGSADMNAQLVAGNIDCGFDTSLATLPLHRSNKFRIIAVGTNTTWNEVPDATLFKNIIPNLTWYNWYGIAMIKDAPTTTRGRIFSALQRMNQDTVYRDNMKKLGLEIVDTTRNGNEWIDHEIIKNEKIRKQLGIEKIN